MNQPNGVEFATTPLLSTGVRLHYAERGDPTGEAIVFLHGYSDSWFSFSRILPLLSPSYHAFALTERGHGDSDKPECCYTLLQVPKGVPNQEQGGTNEEQGVPDQEQYKTNKTSKTNKKVLSAREK
jgi:pimeloyl-ACP methyl ester carboxylesterase